MFVVFCVEPCGTIRMGHVYLGENRKIDPKLISPYNNDVNCFWTVTVRLPCSNPTSLIGDEPLLHPSKQST